MLNVEGNFFPNVDYDACFRRGIHVLGCGPAYAQAVAEYALGLAIDLARGISREDRAFREGRERYVTAGNADAILLRHGRIGLVGYGNLGRALHRLLVPFEATIRAFDPWLPASTLREAGLVPSTLAEVLANSDIVFVLATVTAESERLIGPAELDLLPPAARLVLVSRAAVIDLDALLERVAAGRLLAAIDVWPAEPVPADEPARRLEGLVLSAHRAGGIPAAFLEIGEMVLDDLDQVRAGLPPVRMQPAARELVDALSQPPGELTATMRLAPDAIVFDCDGVLVDSDDAVVDAWSAWAVAYGFDPAAVVEVCHGQPARATVAAFLAPGDVAAGIAVIDRLELELAHDVRGLPGARDLLASLPDRSMGDRDLGHPRPGDDPAGGVGDRAPGRPRHGRRRHERQAAPGGVRTRAPATRRGRQPIRGVRGRADRDRGGAGGRRRDGDRRRAAGGRGRRGRDRRRPAGRRLGRRRPGGRGSRHAGRTRRLTSVRRMVHIE